MSQETIFALASGAGRAAIAVIRISGPATRNTVTHLCGTLPPQRKSSLRRLRNRSGEILDQGIILWFAGPGSFTGEDCAELHLHGGNAVIEGMADALVDLGLRPAEAGEFTRRAFLNGKLDLTEAEAVADLIDAETSAQRRQALQQLDGGLSRQLETWTATLTRVLAWQETLIDFPDEDLPAEVDAALRTDLLLLRQEMAQALNEGAKAEKLREGLIFTILGKPNAGKSSLLNSLASRDAAIVSSQPGTTRDTIEVRLVLAGVPVTLIDTAGLRDSADSIEAEGVRRALARAESADLVLRTVDISTATEADFSAEQWPGSSEVRSLMIGTKSDLPYTPPSSPDIVLVSTLTGDGMERLKTMLEAEARALTSHATGAPLTRARHRAALQDAIQHLEDAESARLEELRAEEIRLARQAVGRITGQIGVEQILDHVFSSFCIGK
ncbi:tRNA uridine-5-carboxymethylaminomethyl(34) synthesis GTPase MnmE [Granulibacter bethesdensis]|uniref:tRNA uridine-5-carboxymethylaminomethyl(34) synthesis GTPase MnmE n=1 Tax=Granulibacter bethesdensis TaxID=364410 RepID=UPI00090BEDAC|nr:tRNA uridine-5-carboxymethylaminomethyl(34) synthesis GTPase MnmE [Granulibacter bethesdensis]APH50671.1 tRNA (5-carboxymethylaminomethyl-2-thiouridylate) synthase [Granulibacter bethesdensis]